MRPFCAIIGIACFAAAGWRFGSGEWSRGALDVLLGAWNLYNAFAEDPV